MYNLKKIKPATYLLPQEGDMRVPGLIIASKEILKKTLREQRVEELFRVPSLMQHQDMQKIEEKIK